MTEQTEHVIVGLGNPGAGYAGNRHNIGFMVLDELARRRELVYRTDLANCLWAADDHCTLLRPMTYMNLSGEALAAWSARSQVTLTGQPKRDPAVGADDEPGADPDLTRGVRPLVICDDLALPLGSLRMRARGSSGGQNGLGSVIEHLGGEEFPRLRLGIAPQDDAVSPQEWPDYVLADFTAAEAEAVQELIDHAAEAVQSWLENDLQVTISRFNRRIRPEN